MMLDQIQLMIDVLEQGCKRAFSIKRILMPPDSFVRFYQGAIAHRPLCAADAMFAGIPVRCSNDVSDITLDITLKPDAMKRDAEVAGIH